jgi:hypothetical protein
MTPASEFPKLLDLALVECQTVTRELLAKHELATYASWSLDVENARMLFQHASGKTFGASIQIIGTLTGTTWEWAWASLEWPSRLTQIAAEARGWGATNSVSLLTEARMNIDEVMAWKLTAFSARHYGWSAIYRGQSQDNRFVFLTFQVPLA